MRWNHSYVISLCQYCYNDHKKVLVPCRMKVYVELLGLILGSESIEFLYVLLFYLVSLTGILVKRFWMFNNVKMQSLSLFEHCISRNSLIELMLFAMIWSVGLKFCISDIQRYDLEKLWDVEVNKLCVFLHSHINSRDNKEWWSGLKNIGYQETKETHPQLHHLIFIMNK